MAEYGINGRVAIVGIGDARQLTTADGSTSSYRELTTRVERRRVTARADYSDRLGALGISVGTVMSRVFYARQRLKAALADEVLP